MQDWLELLELHLVNGGHNVVTAQRFAVGALRYGVGGRRAVEHEDGGCLGDGQANIFGDDDARGNLSKRAMNSFRLWQECS